MPLTKCKLRELRLERIKDYLLLEQEFITNQEAFKPSEAKAEAEKNKVEELRGSPMSIGTLEEIIDDNHAIVSTTHGPEYYVGICSFVDKDLIEPGCTVLLHNKVRIEFSLHMSFEDSFAWPCCRVSHAFSSRLPSSPSRCASRSWPSSVCSATMLTRWWPS